MYKILTNRLSPQIISYSSCKWTDGLNCLSDTDGGRMIANSRCRLMQDIRLFRLASIPNNSEAFAKQDVILWDARSVCSITAVSSANVSSLTSCFDVLEWACSRHTLNRLSSVRNRIYTPSSSFRYKVAWFNIMLINIENMVNARTQSCFTPFILEKNCDKSPSCRILPNWSSWSWMIISRNVGGQPSCSSPPHRVESFSQVDIREVESSKSEQWFNYMLYMSKFTAESDCRICVPA